MRKPHRIQYSIRSCGKLWLIFATIVMVQGHASAASDKDEKRFTSVEGVSIVTSFSFHNAVASDAVLGQPEEDSSKASVYTNLGVGYTWSPGLHLGVTMLRQTSSERRSDDAGHELSHRVVFQSFGPRIGYETSWGLSLYLSYLMQSKANGDASAIEPGAETEVELEVRDTSGVLAEIGYAFSVFRAFSFGPQVSYMSRYYRKMNTTWVSQGEAGSRQDRGAFKETTVQPQLAFWLKF